MTDAEMAARLSALEADVAALKAANDAWAAEVAAANAVRTGGMGPSAATNDEPGQYTHDVAPNAPR